MENIDVMMLNIDVMMLNIDIMMLNIDIMMLNIDVIMQNIDVIMRKFNVETQCIMMFMQQISLLYHYILYFSPNSIEYCYSPIFLSHR